MGLLVWLSERDRAAVIAVYAGDISRYPVSRRGAGRSAGRIDQYSPAEIAKGIDTSEAYLTG